MKALMYYLLGYLTIEFSDDALRRALNFANLNGIKLFRVISNAEKAIIFVREKEGAILESFLERNCIEFCRISHGLPKIWRTYRHRVGLLSGLLIFVVAMYISPMFIWEVNVTGADKLSREYIMAVLKKEGVKVGAFSPAINRKRVYMNIMRTVDDISWLSVNMRGSSANVEIRERDGVDKTANSVAGANLVASKDGQIVYADIIRGRAAVKVGSVVKAGNLLVSGVIDTAMMGTRYVYSNAKVYARVNDEYEIEIPMENSERKYNGETVLECYVDIFGKRINIFKKSPNSSENYDTIEEEKNIPVVGLDKVPISLCRTVAMLYTDVPVLLSEEQALEKARAELARRISENDTYTDILSKEEQYEVKDGVFVYKCFTEAIENIAVVSEFSLSD